MTIHLDEELKNADWTKQTWDLLDVNNKEELLAFLKVNNTTLVEFKKLPIYQFNKDKIGWLKGL